MIKSFKFRISITNEYIRRWSIRHQYSTVELLSIAINYKKLDLTSSQLALPHTLCTVVAHYWNVVERLYMKSPFYRFLKYLRNYIFMRNNLEKSKLKKKTCGAFLTTLYYYISFSKILSSIFSWYQIISRP